jgi:hypothetical protein
MYPKPKTREDVNNLQWQLSRLENLLSHNSGNLSDEEFEIRSDISKIKKLLMEYSIEESQNTQKPDNSQYECFGCGS